MNNNSNVNHLVRQSDSTSCPSFGWRFSIGCLFILGCSDGAALSTVESRSAVYAEAEKLPIETFTNDGANQISGKVLNLYGEPLEGATVSIFSTAEIESTIIGASHGVWPEFKAEGIIRTNAVGEFFSVGASYGGKSIVVEYPGFQTQSRSEIYLLDGYGLRDLLFVLQEATWVEAELGSKEMRPLVDETITVVPPFWTKKPLHYKLNDGLLRLSTEYLGDRQLCWLVVESDESVVELRRPREPAAAVEISYLEAISSESEHALIRQPSSWYKMVGAIRQWATTKSGASYFWPRFGLHEPFIWFGFLKEQVTSEIPSVVSGHQLAKIRTGGGFRPIFVQAENQGQKDKIHFARADASGYCEIPLLSDRFLAWGIGAAGDISYPRGAACSPDSELDTSPLSISRFDERLSPDGAIFGFVFDRSGLGLPNVRVYIQGPFQRFPTKFETTSDGFFKATGLRPGLHRVFASWDGQGLSQIDVVPVIVGVSGLSRDVKVSLSLSRGEIVGLVPKEIQEGTNWVMRNMTVKKVIASGVVSNKREIQVKNIPAALIQIEFFVDDNPPFLTRSILAEDPIHYHLKF